MEFIHVEENKIKYLEHPEESIFAGMKIRENPQEAFDNAIKRGMKNPEEWMYMYSKNNKDFFKNCNTRNYISYLQFDSKERRKHRDSKEAR